MSKDFHSFAFPSQLTTACSRDFASFTSLHVSINAIVDVYLMNGLQVSSWDLEPTQQNIAHLQQVVKDLETVHNPQTSNTQRLQSQSVLTWTTTS